MALFEDLIGKGGVNFGALGGQNQSAIEMARALVGLYPQLDPNNMQKANLQPAITDFRNQVLEQRGNFQGEGQNPYSLLGFALKQLGQGENAFAQQGGLFPQQTEENGGNSGGSPPGSGAAAWEAWYGRPAPTVQGTRERLAQGQNQSGGEETTSPGGNNDILNQLMDLLRGMSGQGQGQGQGGGYYPPNFFQPQNMFTGQGSGFGQGPSMAQMFGGGGFGGFGGGAFSPFGFGSPFNNYPGYNFPGGNSGFSLRNFYPGRRMGPFGQPSFDAFSMWQPGIGGDPSGGQNQNQNQGNDNNGGGGEYFPAGTTPGGGGYGGGFGGYGSGFPSQSGPAFMPGQGGFPIWDVTNNIRSNFFRNPFANTIWT